MKPIIKKTLVVVCVFVSLFVLFWLVCRFSPYPQLELFLSRQNSIRYYDRNGILLQITPLDDGLRREWTQEIPSEVKDIFVFAEDRRFYRHAGVDIFSLFRALYQNITERRRVSGASTITMQFARLIADNAQNTNPQPVNISAFMRKTAEIINALRLETRFSKDEILHLYLNSLPFGHNTEGLASAARTFFSRDIDMLSPSQIFILAVIPRRPSLYNPFNNPEVCLNAAINLHSRYTEGKNQINIDSYDWDFASASVRRFHYPFELPHLIRFLNSYYSANRFPESGEVHLSIDIGLQNYLEGNIYGNVMRHHSSRITNGSALVIDNYSGEILAWVGSADFFNARDAGQIDGVLALNQPGSSMKPFLYAMALETGFKPTDVIADIQMNFGIDEVYIPRNFNERFNGPMLFRAALASSLNIPAVYLLYRQGVKNYGDLLFELGFHSIENSIDDAGLGLALGNAPVSLLELVRAFSVFPRDGIFLPVTWEYKREEQIEREEKRIFSPDTARIINSFLSDSNARTLAFGAGRNFRTSFPAIFKTGTANQFQSIVALGASKRYTSGVWMGNFTGETVIGRTGSSVPAAIVRDALIFLQAEYDNSDFPVPENWQLQRICSLSGMSPNSACLSVIEEFVEIGEAKSVCTWHRFSNGRSETVFPAEYQSWFTAADRQGAIDHSSRPLEIVSPRSGFVYLSGSGIGISEIPAEAIGGEDDVLHITHNDFSFSIERPFIFHIPRIQGDNRLFIQNGEEEAEVFFTVQ